MVKVIFMVSFSERTASLPEKGCNEGWTVVEANYKPVSVHLFKAQPAGN